MEGAHEKGGVEGEIGRFRRRWLVPVPRVASLAELNARLAEADAAEDARRHIEYRAATVGGGFRRRGAAAAAAARGRRSIPRTVLWPRVDRYARISVGKCRYSVPARLIGPGCGCGCPRTSCTSSTGRGWSRCTRGWSRPGTSTWSWITTWRSWSASRARCPGRLPLAQARAGGGVHRRARGVLGRGAGQARRRGRDPGADRGAAAAPAAARRAVTAGITRRAGGGELLAGRGRGRGPQARRRGRPGRPARPPAAGARGGRGRR